MFHSHYLSKAYVLIALNLDFASPEQAFENTGLTVERLNDMEQLEFELALQLIRNLNRYSHTPLWPTILGAHLSVTSHGPVGYATISAPSLGKAIATFIDWGQVRFDCYNGQIVEYEERMEVVIRDTTNSVEFQRFFFECFIRAFEVLITLIMGKPAKGLTEIHMQRSDAAIQAPMRQEYDSTVYFAAEANKLVVPKELWYTRSALYDKASYEFNLRLCQQLLNSRQLDNRPDLAVKNAISSHFDKVQSDEIAACPPPKLPDICRQLHMSERTLIRKLKSHNTSYQAILEKERAEVSVRLLQNARYRVYDIAELLGYRESANFCRAFKNWYGVSPSDYRRGKNA